jgi:hypothetical protein
MRYLMCALMMTATLEAAAQESRGVVYVAAGMSFPHQAALQAGSPPPFAAPGGSTVGWLVGGGVFLSPRLSIEVDVSRTGVMRAREAGRHDTSEVSTRRDRFVSFGLKAHLPSAVHVEPVAGIVLVGNEGTFSSLSGDFRGYFPLAWNPGIVFGADFRIGGRHLAFVPGLRFMFSGVPNGTQCIIGFSGEPLCGQREPRWQGQYPRWTQRPSVTLGVNF